jgi:hypothetical protein
MSDEIYTPLAKKDKQPIRYQCFQPEVRNQILSVDIPDEVRKHLNELYDLIFYQMQRISEQESQMIAIKHKYAWKHYDEGKKYDSKTRKYTTD